MKFVVVVLCISFVVCSSLSSVGGDDNSLTSEQKRDVDERASHTRQQINEIIRNLRDAAQQALEAIGDFTGNIKDEIKLYLDKIHSDRQRLRKRLSKFITKISDDLIDAGDAIATCIESHREEADRLIEQTYTRSRACADDRIKEVNDMIDDLITESNTALDYSKDVLESMRNCSIEDDGSFLNVAKCLSPLTDEAQSTGRIFALNSGISIARINMALGSLPAAFEVCAGFNVMRAMVGSGKILFDIGKCSAKSFITSFR